MNIFNITEISHKTVSMFLKKGEIAIDATAGHGMDTLFLAKQVGRDGHVYAFDIQKCAITSTEGRLIIEGLRHRTSLIEDSHEHIDCYVKDPIGCAMFNLGYLPKSDKTIITSGRSSVIAIKKCTDLLKLKGIISICIYTSHDGAKEEATLVEGFLQQLSNKKYKVLKYGSLNDESSPYIVFIYRIK